MDTYNIHEAKTHLSKLIERVLAGEEIVIGRSGKPVAKLVPYVEKKKPRRAGTLKGKIWLAPDWDSDETNEEIARLFYGEDDG
ncbi:MAG: type II toxin-antitoxin system Phd/YefM family antitoxin [Actinobacteria bacterium]|nr:type II toxin-antitoxin system Phd/YefM family antitoxin [Actinomycetota bacterium]